MYKIYINGTPLFLVSTAEGITRPSTEGDKIVAPYTGNSKMLLNYLDMLEKNQRFESVTLYAPSADKLFEDFAGQFRIIEAAGGLVYNEKGEILMIYRRGHWDLPKGKIDEGEGPQQAAVREVKEETGLKAIELGDYIGLTYHTYRDGKNRRILKRTFWYRMAASQEELQPEVEEDIERAEWRAIRPLMESHPEMYGNIRGLLEAELQRP